MPNDGTPRAIRLQGQQRLEILAGLLRAVDEMDHIHAVVSRCKSRAEAHDALGDLGYSDVQSDHVLDLTVSRLTQDARQHLIDEHDKVKSRLDDLGGDHG
jgi:DNA gyrase subunit A